MSTLLELMSADPMKMTKEDIKQIIHFYRERRAQFNLGNITAGNVKPPSPKLAAAIKLAPSDLDL